MDCQFLELPVWLDLYNVRLMTVLKSPPIITVELEKSDGMEKKLWNKRGSSELGP